MASFLAIDIPLWKEERRKESTHRTWIGCNYQKTCPDVYQCRRCCHSLSLWSSVTSHEFESKTLETVILQINRTSLWRDYKSWQGREVSKEREKDAASVTRDAGNACNAFNGNELTQQQRQAVQRLQTSRHDEGRWGWGTEQRITNNQQRTTNEERSFCLRSATHLQTLVSIFYLSIFYLSCISRLHSLESSYHETRQGNNNHCVEWMMRRREIIFLFSSPHPLQERVWSPYQRPFPSHDMSWHDCESTSCPGTGFPLFCLMWNAYSVFP